MPIAEIELDNGLELTPRFRGRDRDAEVPAHLLETLGQRGDQQVLLAIEVPVEAAMRHLQRLHQLSDADTRARLAEPARRGMHDPLAGLLLMFERVTHPVEMIYVISNRLSRRPDQTE